MKNIISGIVISMFLISLGNASFMYKEIDPVCSLTGTTHTYFPGEISDTSSWSIPVAYQGECDDISELTQTQKEKVYEIMLKFYEDKDFIWSLYGDDFSFSGSENTLNPNGQNYVNKKLFPALIEYINKERNKINPNTKNIAIIHYVASIVGYDYFLQK